MANSWDDIKWYHLDGTECVAGWLLDSPNQGMCIQGGGPITPCPNITVESAEDVTGLSIGALREALIDATELNGAFGKNIHESKAVLVRVDGAHYPLAQVSVGFVNGSFCLILQGRTDGI